MLKHNQKGEINGVGLSLIVCATLLVLTLVFAVWAYAGRQDYKNNVDSKIAAAQEVAKQQESSRKDKEFAEKEKSPLKTYNGPASYGSLVITYPKTWSGAVDDTGQNTDSLVDGYFYPGVVPSTSNPNSTFALRVQVTSQAYSEVLKNLQGLEDDTNNPASISPYALPKVPSVVGVVVNGALPDQKSGKMVVLPLRNQALMIWTEGNQFTSDFDNIILPNFSFSP